MDKLVIWRSAKVLIDHHGEKARAEALDRIANAHEDGKSDVEAVADTAGDSNVVGTIRFARG